MKVCVRIETRTNTNTNSAGVLFVETVICNKGVVLQFLRILISVFVYDVEFDTKLELNERFDTVKVWCIVKFQFAPYNVYVTFHSLVLTGIFRTLVGSDPIQQCVFPVYFHKTHTEPAALSENTTKYMGEKLKKNCTFRVYVNIGSHLEICTFRATRKLLNTQKCFLLTLNN